MESWYSARAWEAEQRSAWKYSVAIELFSESEWSSPLGVVSKDLEETTSEVNDDNIEGDESVQDAVTTVVRKKVVDVSHL